MVAIQVRDVPADVREALAREARSRGESLQAYLLEVLEREARAARNRATLSTWSPIKGTATTGQAHEAPSVAALRVEREHELTARATARPRS